MKLIEYKKHLNMKNNLNSFMNSRKIQNQINQTLQNKLKQGNLIEKQFF